MVDYRPVSCCAFNYDGSYLVTAGWTGFMKLWSMPQCNNIITVKAHEERITGLATNSNPAYATINRPAIASGSADKTIRLWTPDGILVDELLGHEDRICRIAFHPSGRFLVTACYDQTWRLWDLGQMTQVCGEK